MRNKHAILSAKGLHKQYGKRMVVKDVDVSLERGEIVGLLGPNGAGKTTSFYMITGMIKPLRVIYFWMIMRSQMMLCIKELARESVI